MGVICAKCFPGEQISYFGSKITLIETNKFVKLQRKGTLLIFVIQIKIMLFSNVFNCYRNYKLSKKMSKAVEEIFKTVVPQIQS